MVHKRRGELKRKQTAAGAAPRAAEMANETARVADPQETRVRFAEEIAHVGSAVARELSLPGILEVVLDEAFLTLGAQFALVYLTDEHQRVLELSRAPEPPRRSQGGTFARLARCSNARGSSRSSD